MKMIPQCKNDLLDIIYEQVAKQVEMFDGEEERKYAKCNLIREHITFLLGVYNAISENEPE